MGKSAAAPTILVTAFEPFGMPGKPKRPENASETVIRAFEDRGRGRRTCVVLPVDPRCEVVLARALHGAPAGIVAMGEAGLPGTWDTNVETIARDLPVTASRPAGPAEERCLVAGLASPFAASIPLLEGMEREDRIGSWWCNRAYFRVLQWCRLFGRHGVFLHLRVEGDRARQLRHLEHVVAAMEREISAAP